MQSLSLITTLIRTEHIRFSASLICELFAGRKFVFLIIFEYPNSSKEQTLNMFGEGREKEGGGGGGH